MSESVPKSGEFHNGKLWFARKGTLITVGITDSAIEDVGEVQSVEFPDEGSDFQKGEIVATVDGASGKLEVIAPAAGVIQEVNGAAKDEPEMIADDPFEEGWLYRIEIDDPTDLIESA